jgi:hypothetical protein
MATPTTHDRVAAEHTKGLRETLQPMRQPIRRESLHRLL